MSAFGFSDFASTRQDRRVGLSIPVVLNVGGEQIHGITENFSVSGMFIKTLAPIEDRAFVKMTVAPSVFPDGLSLTGVVVHSRVNPPKRAGVGLTLFGNSAKALGAWLPFVERLVDFEEIPPYQLENPSDDYVVLRFDDPNNLRTMVATQLLHGSAFVRSETPFKLGQQVCLQLSCGVHELELDAVVRRLGRESRKLWGADFRLELDERQRTHLSDFVQLGTQ